jgi:hypothetical protein
MNNRPQGSFEQASGQALTQHRPQRGEPQKALQLKGRQQSPASAPGRVKQGPTAAPVYRPSPTPKVLQQQAAGSRQAETRQAKERPKPPPVYKPQHVPKVLQTKTLVTPQPIQQPRRATVAPPAYRPQPVPKVLQLKPTRPQPQAQAMPKGRAPVAPPSYRPQPARIVQPQMAVAAPTSAKAKTPLAHGPRHAGRGIVQAKPSIAQASAARHGVIQCTIEKPENISLLEKTLQSLGVAIHTGGYIKILHNAIIQHDDDEMDEAMRYIWDMASRYCNLPNRELSFQFPQHPRQSLMEKMGTSSNPSIESLYHGVYRKEFEGVPRDQLPSPSTYFKELNEVADKHHLGFKFTPQGKEGESFRGHYQNMQNPQTQEGQHSKQLLEKAQAIRVLRKSSPSAKTLARLTFTINPQRLKAAMDVLTFLTSNNSVINDFKVMGIQNLGQGPDDIVVYLSDIISSDGVRKLINELEQHTARCFSETREGFLRRSNPPLGMQEMGTGIYGADMPSDVKLIKEGQGSHGMNMSMLMSQALKGSQQNASPLDMAFDQSFGKSGLNTHNPAFSNILVYDNRRLRLGQSTMSGMNCFIDSILQVAHLNTNLTNTIAQNLEAVGIRNIGQMIETHSNVMNTIVAQICQDAHTQLTVRIVHQNPYNGELGHMDVGNGPNVVYVFYSHAHYSPLFPN